MGDRQRSPLDLRLLEPFVVLAEELHFRRAAERLHVAQPALSQQIGRLERQLGMQLFTRPPEAVALTVTGRVLLERLRPALAEIRAAVAAAESIAEGWLGTLGLSHLSSLASRVVPALSAAFSVRYPDVSLRPCEASVEEQLGFLRTRTADVGLLHLNPDVDLNGEGVEVEVLARGPRYVAVRADHRWADAGSIEFEALDSETWIMPSGTGAPGLQAAMFLGTCRRHGFEPRIAQRANSIETMLGLVSSGLGIATTPWATALNPPRGLSLVRIENESVALVAVRRVRTPVSDAFVGEAKVVATDLVRTLG